MNFARPNPRVVPAKAGTHVSACESLKAGRKLLNAASVGLSLADPWVPAFAGMEHVNPWVPAFAGMDEK
jgi:hypothetical protein